VARSSSTSRLRSSHTRPVRPVQPIKEPEFFTRDECANFLSSSTAFVDKLIQSQEIRAYKAGAKVLISISSVLQFIEANPLRPRRHKK
jgi:excisionase family DNA binding protein